MVTTAIQLYTLRKFDVSKPDEVRIAGETDVDAVELVYTGRPSEETLAALKETGLSVVGVTVGLDDLRNDVDEVVDSCRKMSCETVILGHLEESYFKSREATRETAELLSEFARQLDELGLRFRYHTHRYEFEDRDGGSYFPLLARTTAPLVEFEIDLGWVVIAGRDPAAVLREHADAGIESVHLKDMHADTKEFANLGEGDLDVTKAAEAAIDTGVATLVYEHEDPSDPVESVVSGASTLTKFQRRRLSR